MRCMRVCRGRMADYVQSVPSHLAPSSPQRPMEEFSRGRLEVPSFDVDPHSPLVAVMRRYCRLGDGPSLVANVLSRAVLALETENPGERAEAVKSFQSDLYQGFANLMDHHHVHSESHLLFALFNEDTFRLVSPKVHRDRRQLIQRLVMQCLLRFILSRKENSALLDPNYVLQVAGTRAFCSMYDRLFLDGGRLTGASVDQILQSMSSPAGKWGHLSSSANPEFIRFEAVHFLAHLGPTAVDLDEPLVPQSAWSWGRVLDAICGKQSAEMLAAFFSVAPRPVQVLALERLRAVSPVTGLPRTAWAMAAVHRWELPPDRVSDQSPTSPMLEVPPRGTVWSPATPADLQTHLAPVDAEVSSGSLPRLLDNDRIFLIDSLGSLASAFRHLHQNPPPLMGLSALSSATPQTDSTLISLATHDAAFVIDLSPGRFLDGEAAPQKGARGYEASARYLVQWVLSNPAIAKYCVPALLDQLQSLFGLNANPLDLSPNEQIHFENLVDLRSPRSIKQTRLVPPPLSDPLHVSTMLAGARSMAEAVSVAEGHSRAVREELGEWREVDATEWQRGNVSLSDLSEQWLGAPHSRSAVWRNNWQFRPLSTAQVAFAARDAHVLVRLQVALTAAGSVPSEVLSFDPWTDA